MNYLKTPLFNLSFSQEYKGAGFSTMYNMQTESFGIGLRAELPIKKLFSSLAHLIYYPKFNKINEFIIGISVKYKFYNPQYNKKVFYVLSEVAYSAWFNYKDSYVLDAKFNNWNFELGGGFALRYCISPFIEYRYNIILSRL